MNKQYLALAVALTLTLTACGGERETENAPPTAATTAAAAPVETAKATAAATAAPSPSAAPSPRATPIPEPTESLRASPAGPTPAAEPDPTADPTPPPVTAPPTPEPVEVTAEPVEEPVIPSDEEVLAAYRTATEAYSWFAGYDDSGLALDREDVEYRPDLTYYRVTRPGLGSLNELRGYLKNLFSDEVVDALMGPGMDRFVEGDDGGLYARAATRERDPSVGGVVLSVRWEEGSATSCVVQATAEILSWAEDGSVQTAQEREYEFPYQKVGERWMFTQFTSIF